MVYYRWVDVAADFKGLKVMLELSNGKKYRIVPTTKVQQLDLSAEGKDAEVYINNSTALFGTRKNKQLHTLFGI